MTTSPSAFRSTLFVSAARVLSMILFLVQGMISATYFGASADKDSYLVAQTFPGLLTMLLLGGAYATQLLLLAEIGREEGIQGQVDFLRATLWRIVLILLPFVLIAFLFP